MSTFCRSLIFLAVGYLLQGCVVDYNVQTEIQVPKEFMGISDSVNNGLENTPYLNSLGVQWVRTDFTWSQIEPAQGKWNFKQFDDDLATATADGEKILGILDYSVDWLFDKGIPRSFVPEDKIPYFLDYVRTVVSRYKGTVGAWEIWNEPNSLVFWQGPREAFFELTKQTIKAIREIDPDVKIIVGSTLMMPARWMEAMHQYGGFEGSSGFSFHPYWIDDLGSIGLIDKANHIADALNYQGEKWITEIGFPTGGLYPSSTDELKQATRLMKIYSLAAIKGIAKVFWYCLKDDPSKNHFPIKINSEAYFGLYDSDFREKPAAKAYRAMAKILPGSMYSPHLIVKKENTDKNIICLPFLKDGELYLVMWTEFDSKKYFSLRYNTDQYSFLDESEVEEMNIHSAPEGLRGSLDSRVTIIHLSKIRGGTIALTEMP